MYRRQKVLLYLIFLLNKHNKKITKTYLDKLLFLLKKESNIENFVKFYNFYPHLYGPFSNQFYLDLSDLQSRGYLDERFNLDLTLTKICDELNKDEINEINSTINKFCQVNIIDYVYKRYPEYTVKSINKSSKRNSKKTGIFSIGYEKKDIDKFLDILIQNSIDTVVDVRFNPFSMNFSFTKRKLTNSLKNAQIGYDHVPELGVAGEHRKNLDRDSDYKKLFSFYKINILAKQQSAIKNVYELGKNRRIALLCFEQDERYCHRGILSKTIEELYEIPVTHL